MKRRAFTLVELLVAMVVGVLVAGSALLALSSSFSAWTRLASGGTLLETDKAMLRLERDISSALPLPDAPFSGEARSLALPLERDGSLRVATWSAEGSRLVRSERDYLFDGEASFDGRAPDGTALPVRLETYRLAGPARFAYQATPADERDGAPSFTADCATNLPAAVLVCAGDHRRACPTRLSLPK